MKDQTIAFRRIVRVRRVLKELGYDPEDVLGALDDLKQLRAEVKRVNDLAIHLSNGGRDPDEKCYSKRDVEALVAITRAVEKKHDTQRRGDQNYLDGKSGHYWTCAKCQYVNDAGIRFNRCGGCDEFQGGSASSAGAEPK